MILQFSDLDSLKLALTSGAVPGEVYAAPATVGFDEDGFVFVDTDETVPNTARKALRKLGVKGRRSWPRKVEKQPMLTWLQAFPVERAARSPEIDDRTPVLFELENGELLSDLVNEMLRLGNDRQAFRYVTQEPEDSESNVDDGSVLLRVIGPPYYSLLRAFDRDGRSAQPTAFVERSSRVWVEAGFDHPFADRLNPPPGSVWLLQPSFEWRTLDEAPFTEVYELLDFELPNSATTLADEELDQRLSVPLRLGRGGPAEGGELWVLDDKGVEQLDEFVRTSRDQVLDRLAFAVGEWDGERMVVIRIRPGRGTPPVVVLDGLAYRPYLKLSNLFLPVGTRLHPPLRRDTVKSLLSDDDALITWLRPDEAGESFTPFQLPDTAFRPLTDWVDYVLDRAHESLDAWMRATRFDFDRFVCPEERAERAKKERAKPEAETKSKRPKRDRQESTPKEPVTRPKRGPRDTASVYKVEKPAERRVLEERLRTLEKEFLASEADADAPERLDTWREMARMNAVLGHHTDAAICWTQTFWEDTEPAVESVWEWYSAEWAAGRGTGKGERRSSPEAEPFDADSLEELLTMPNPSPARVQALAAYLVWLVRCGEPRDAVTERLAVIGRFLEKQETLLSVRASWLAAGALYELSNGDVLALARRRDSTLERLFDHGLRPDRDLPSFLRGAGLRGGERFRIVRERVVQLRDAAQEWAKRNKSDGVKRDTARTAQYVDLVFAFGLGRLGETDQARQLLDDANRKLSGIDAIHHWLAEAFGFRVAQAVDGKPTSTPLPENLLDDLEAAFTPSDEEREAFSRKEIEELEKQMKLDRYKVDRMRQNSRILEPHERIDAYRRFNKGFANELTKELVDLTDVTDRGELTGRVTALLDRNLKPTERVFVLTGYDGGDLHNRAVGLLDIGPRVGQILSERILEAAVTLYADEESVVRRAVLLERSLYLAGHFDLRDTVATLVGSLHALLEQQREADLGTMRSLQQLFGESFRGLRRLGMREDIARLLQRLETLVDGIAVPRSKSKSKNVAEWRKVVVESSKMQLQVASGWFYFGDLERAWPIVDRVRKLLFGTNDLMPVHRTQLACAYATTLGQSPVEEAVPRMMQIFRDLDGIGDSTTTNTHYSVSQLNVVEATVLAMVGDDMVLDRGARRWLDEDEYLVRRRIHRDVREAMDGRT